MGRQQHNRLGGHCFYYYGRKRKSALPRQHREESAEERTA